MKQEREEELRWKYEQLGNGKSEVKWGKNSDHTRKKRRSSKSLLENLIKFPCGTGAFKMFKLEILQDTKIVKLIIIIIRETDPEIKHESIYPLSI